MIGILFPNHSGSLCKRLDRARCFDSETCRRRQCSFAKTCETSLYTMSAKSPKRSPDQAPVKRRAACVHRRAISTLLGLAFFIACSTCHASVSLSAVARLSSSTPSSFKKSSSDEPIWGFLFFIPSPLSSVVFGGYLRGGIRYAPGILPSRVARTASFLRASCVRWPSVVCFAVVAHSGR
jgi:hypothetical protein